MLFMCLFYLGSNERHKVSIPNCVPQGVGGICKLALCLVCFECIVFTLVEFLIITFKIILQVLEMDMAVSAIIE